MSIIKSRDVFGRDAEIDVHLDGSRIVIVTPMPNSANLDWRGAEELITELIRLRAQLPGIPS